jgi:hypothetical protein
MGALDWIDNNVTETFQGIMMSERGSNGNFPSGYISTTPLCCKISLHLFKKSGLAMYRSTFIDPNIFKKNPHTL